MLFVCISIPLPVSFATHSTLRFVLFFCVHLQLSLLCVSSSSSTYCYELFVAELRLEAESLTSQLFVPFTINRLREQQGEGLDYWTAGDRFLARTDFLLKTTGFSDVTPYGSYKSKSSEEVIASIIRVK
jgi:hypothetical protein